MATVDLYGYHDTFRSRKRSLFLERTITVAVDPRNSTVQTTLRTQDLPRPEPESMSRQLLRYISILTRLALILLLLPSKPVVRLCRTLKGWCLCWLKCALASVPHYIRSLDLSWRTQVRTRCPILCRAIDRIIQLPGQIMQAIMNLQEATRRDPRHEKIENNHISLNTSINGVVTIELVERYSMSIAGYEFREGRFGISQSLPWGDPDDVPTLETPRMPQSIGENMLSPSSYRLQHTRDNSCSSSHPQHTIGSGSSSHRLPDAGDNSNIFLRQQGTGDNTPTSYRRHDDGDNNPSSYREETDNIHSTPYRPQDFGGCYQQRDSLLEDLPMENLNAINNSPGPSFSTPQPISCEGGAPTIRAVSSERHDQVKPADDFPNGTIRPISKPYRAQLHPHSTAYSPEPSETYNDYSGPPDAEISSDFSPFGRDESFSPEQFPFPDVDQEDSLLGLWTRPTSSLQEEREAERTSTPAPIPVPANTKAKARRPSGSPGSLSHSSAQDTIRIARKRSQSLEGVATDVHFPYEDAFPPQVYPDYCPSETRSCCDEEPYVPRSRIKRHHQSETETETCAEPCISCETCDRRHRRVARRSRIPRRTKPQEGFRPRSSSFNSYHPAQSTVPATTVVRKKLLKRQVKPY